MMWTAIVPVNVGRPCKTRLAGRLDPAARVALVAAMARHVLGVLDAAPAVTRILVLAPERPAFTGAAWIADTGGGLNAELATARGLVAAGAVLFLHADLPLLQEEDVAALLDAATAAGAAIAPDVAGKGTNAVALSTGCTFAPAFGADSLARHRAALPRAPLVARTGLALDIDDAATLDRALAAGFTW